MSVEARPRAMRRLGLVAWICIRRAKGASFCQVERMTPVVRSNPWRTSGSHEWRGAKPTFSARARVIRVIGKGCDVC